MTTTDSADAGDDPPEEAPTADDELPFAVKVMILLIVLAVLGVVLVDVLHFAGAF
jgi:hypothetical protein